MECRQCGVEMTLRNIGRLEGWGGIRVGRYCRNCGKQIIDKLKEECLVEEYKGNKIYMNDGRYVPYWGCHYYFTALADVKKRIDMSHIGIY